MEAAEGGFDSEIALAISEPFTATGFTPQLDGMKEFHKFLTEGKEAGAGPAPLVEAALLIAVMWTFLSCDPFGLNERITGLLRLNFPIFAREPKLSAYACANIGGFIAKVFAAVLAAVFAVFSGRGAVETFGLKPPQSVKWTRYIYLFLIFSLVTRAVYFGNPLIPDLPIRFVYPEAMFIGNAMITFLVVFFAPAAEELIFRGYLYGVFRDRLGAGYSVALTSVLFVLAHIPQSGLNPAGICMMLVTAFALGIARYSSGSIIPSVIFHGVYNLTYALTGASIYLLMGR